MQTHKSAYCKNCKRQTEHVSGFDYSTYQGLIGLSLFTCGAMLPVLLLYCLCKAGTWYCTECGRHR